MSAVRILGIDPGSRITGVGLIDSDGRYNQHVHSSCIRLGNEPFPERLGKIFVDIQAIIKEYQRGHLRRRSQWFAGG